MEYRIIEFNEQTGSVVVLYNHAGRDLGAYGIELPIVDGAFIVGTALDEYLMSHAPTWLIEKENAVKTATNVEEIKQLVNPIAPPEPPPVTEPVPQQPTTLGNINEDYLRALIYQVIEEINNTTV